MDSIVTLWKKFSSTCFIYYMVRALLLSVKKKITNNKNMKHGRYEVISGAVRLEVTLFLRKG